MLNILIQRKEIENIFCEVRFLIVPRVALSQDTTLIMFKMFAC